MTDLLLCFLECLILGLLCGDVITKGAKNRIAPLLIPIFRDLIENLTPGQAQIADQSINELLVWVVSSVLLVIHHV